VCHLLLWLLLLLLLLRELKAILNGGQLQRQHCRLLLPCLLLACWLLGLRVPAAAVQQQGEELCYVGLALAVLLVLLLA
jgi:hypothetical protein